VHFQPEPVGGSAELTPMVVTAERDAAAVPVSILPLLPKDGVGGFVEHGYQQVFGAVEHTRMNRNFVQELRFAPLSPRLHPKVPAAGVLAAG
jgi:hypothetical protein